eukprot:s202_g28.t2
MSLRILSFLALCSSVVAFVPPVQTSTKYQAAVSVPGAAEMPEEAGSWSPLFAGASVGYAVAAVSTVLRQGRVARKAEQQTPAVTGPLWLIPSSPSAGLQFTPSWFPPSFSSVRSAPCSSSSAELTVRPRMNEVIGDFLWQKGDAEGFWLLDIGSDSY